MKGWTFLTNHAAALVHITDHPDTRLRELAAALDITERTAFRVVADLTEAGYIVKERDGRRNRYHVKDELPLLDTLDGQPRVADLLRLLADTDHDAE